MGCIHQTLSLIIQASIWKRNAKDGKSQRWWRTSGKLPDTAGLMHIWTHRDCSSMHMASRGWNKRSQSWDRVADSVSYPSQEAICSWCLLGKEKVFSSRVSLGLSTTLTGDQFCNSNCFYLWTFCFVLAVSVLLVCCSFVLIFVFAGFAFYSCLFDVGVLKGQRYSMIHDVKYKLLIQLRRTICLRCPFANMEKKSQLTLLYHHKWY